jgi:hypothetical protein
VDLDLSYVDATLRARGSLTRWQHLQRSALGKASEANLKAKKANMVAAKSQGNSAKKPRKDNESQRKPTCFSDVGFRHGHGGT